MTIEEALSVVEDFDPDNDGMAAKSRDLTLDLLRLTPTPFSRHQFAPGHITCTALIQHPSRDAVLVMFHHRLRRWLLPGGHVEQSDASLADTAAREAAEETCVRIDRATEPALAGIDVYAIPSRRSDPMHLHHDLIWSFRAASEDIDITGEAPLVDWAEKIAWDRLSLAESIRRSIDRTRSRA